MTQVVELANNLKHAEASLARVVQIWDATNLSACEECLVLLEEVAGHLRTAQPPTSMLSSRVTTEAVDRLNGLRDDVRLIGRLVDSAIAFQRGLAIRTVVEEPAFTEITG